MNLSAKLLIAVVKEARRRIAAAAATAGRTTIREQIIEATQTVRFQTPELRDINDGFIQSLRNSPITTSEMQQVSERFLSNPASIESQILPDTGYTSEEFVGLIRNAITVVSGWSVGSIYIEDDNSHPVDELNLLQTDFKCDICDEPVAAPVTIGCECSQSFCGACITRRLNDANGRGRAAKCRVCYSTFERENVQFNSCFDRVIVDMMDKVLECDTKLDWSDRREEHLEYRRLHQTPIGSPVNPPRRPPILATAVTVEISAGSSAGSSENSSESSDNRGAIVAPFPFRYDWLLPPNERTTTGGTSPVVEENDFMHRSHTKSLLYKQCIVIISMAMLAYVNKLRSM